MRKQHLRNQQSTGDAMTTACPHSRYARRLVEIEKTKSGEPVRDCIKAVAARLRQPYGSIWALLYREPKNIKDVLKDALAREVARTIRLQIGELENELLAVSLGAARRSTDELEEIEADLASLKDRLARAKVAA